MTLLVLEAARDDLIAGFAFYEAREHGIGDHFLACLYSDVESLRIFRGIHRQIYKNLHRSLSKRFPFAIYYTVENNSVIVRAILDCRRNPSWIRSRLRHI